MLRLLRDHPQADVTRTDNLLYMERFMETYDYRSACGAKCAICNIILVLAPSMRYSTAEREIMVAIRAESCYGPARQ